MRKQHKKAKCPECGALVRADSDWRLGGRVACPNCEHTFHVQETPDPSSRLLRLATCGATFALWGLVLVGALVLLFGEPDWKLPAVRNRAGGIVAPERPVPFYLRAFLAAWLAAGLALAGGRAVSEEGEEARSVNLVALLVTLGTAVVGFALASPVAACLNLCVLVPLLLGTLFAYSLTALVEQVGWSRRGPFRPTPPWLVQGFFLVALVCAAVLLLRR
jgi:DNA-directed RNA polymerase subunit RPC12/RpoP